jgi:hypothetical protein
MNHKQLEAEIGAGYLSQILELKGIRASAEYETEQLTIIREVRAMMKKLNSKSVKRAITELDKHTEKPHHKPDQVKGQIQIAEQQSSSIVRKDELDLIKNSAQDKAAGLVVARNVLTAHYVSTEDFSDRPELDEHVVASKSFLEGVLTGSAINYSMDSIILAAAQVAMFQAPAAEVSPEVFTSPAPSGSVSAAA